MDLKQRLALAESITTDAGKIALGHFRGVLDVEAKADESPVTIADKATEAAMRDALATHFPRDAIFGEEFGHSGTSDDLWIIDPIDGTRSFITGLPLFGMLLGFIKAGTPQIGVINMPALSETYAGGSGLGASLNGVPISTSDCARLDAARLFINEGDKLAAEEPEVFARLVTAGALRRMAADCYPHALVASGHADAVVDYDLQPYDYLPVRAVVEAAGGVMTDWAGDPLTMQSDGRTITAATHALHAELLELVGQS